MIDVAIASPRIFRVDAPSVFGPAWLPSVLEPFRRRVADPAYPCHFGRRALELSELFGTYVDAGTDAGSDLAALAEDLSAFLDATRAYPRRRMVLAAFCAPESPDRPHAWYGGRFWSILRYLHEHDHRMWPADTPTSADDPSWEFSFHGTPMFVFAAAPTHVARRSRNLGPSLVLLFQPRNVFAGIEGGTLAGIRARRDIRARQAIWDAVAPHHVMGDYGDPSNFEWRQYYIADDDADLYKSCPVHTAGARRPPSGLLHEVVERQSDLTPDAVALVAGANVLSYRDLDARANRLAHRLLGEGVRPDDRVGVLADRSADTVVALLGVLKAGAAYVPVDPAYPDERRSLMLDDSGVDVVVAPARQFGAVPLGPRRLLAADAPADGVPVTRPASRARPDNLAYVIYTSGSTGTPKGVQVTHRQIMHAVRANLDLERPAPDVFLMPISFSSDASACGTYWTLAAGGRLVLPVDGEHRDPVRLRELIQTYGVTHSDSTPALYDRILGADPAPVRSLRCVLVGGEACPPELVRRHLAALPNCVLENNYGPAEASVWATTHIVAPGGTMPTGPLPIGAPLPNTRIHLLDDQLCAVPVGDPGELYIGGGGVARGYQGRPRLTAERFVPDPFAVQPGQRLYRTGDVAKQRPDGLFVFIGRRDGQVKVRGYRVELGEVEAALLGHPDVAEAIADLRTVGGQPILVGYVRPVRGRTVSGTALAAFLTPLLPRHLVPERFVAVAGVPRTAGGTVDRAALPAGNQMGR